MKKVLLIYGLLVLVILTVVVLRFRGIDLIPKIGGFNKTVTINEQTFRVEIADDEKEQTKGLSNRNSLDKDKGMLFIFPEKGKYSFWMKNVKFPLDIIYISDNKIVDIAKNAAPQEENATNIPIITPKDNANFVLEINGGLSDEYEFKIGDEVTYENIN